MSIAVFIQTQGDSIPDAARQILLVPNNDSNYDEDVIIYHRLTDGKQGPSNKWSTLRSFDDLMEVVNTNEILIANPVGVYVTDNDEDQIQTAGYSQVLTTKAINASRKASPNTNITTEAAINVICEMYEAVSIGSQSLKDLIVDGRRTTIANPSRTVVTVEVESEVEVEPTTESPITKETPHMVYSLATVPNKEIAERYVNRTIKGNVEDFALFDYARANKRNVLIYGPTGPGKTTAVEAWCAARGIRLATISGNAALDPGQLFGKLVPNEDGKLEWIDGPITDAVRNGCAAVLIDEGNFVPMKIITTAYPLTDSRRSLTLLDHKGETIQAHDDLVVFMTMNPDYVGTSPLNAAFRNRFSIQIEWDYDPTVEDKLVSAKNLLAVAQQLRAEAAKGMYDTPIATNMLMEFMEFVPGLGYEFAVENFINHFAPEEQASVRLVLQTHEANIREDFNLDMADSNTFNINI